MGLTRWDDETQSQHLASFGDVLGPVYGALSSDVLWLHGKWLEYRELYAGSGERIQLLNDCAPRFFWMFQNILWHDILLHIARLTDPPHQGKFDNLTLLSLPEAIDDATLVGKVGAALELAQAAAGFARDYRNKHLAHRDLDHALERVEPISAGSRQQVEDVLELFAETLNLVNAHYCDAQMIYRVPMSHGDAQSLLAYLALARDVESKRDARIKAGTFTQEDLERPRAP